MRFFLMPATTSKTLMVPLLLNVSSRMSRATNVPVRPTPAEQWTRRGTPLPLLCDLRTSLNSSSIDVVCKGTP